MRPRARRLATLACVAFATAALAGAATPQPAAAFDPGKPLCKAVGLVSGLFGKACDVATHPGRLIGAGKKLLGGHVGGAVKVILGDSGSAATAATAVVGLAAVVKWAVGGATAALHETAKLIMATAAPRLAAPWFSLVYWRVAGIAALLTLPFLFAAAVQGVLRADVSLILRAAFGYLPLAMLAVAVAAQLAALLIAVTDELCTLVSSAAGGAAPGLLTRAGHTIGGLTIAAGSPFLAFLVAVFTVVGAIVLWIEMMIRQAAVYVIVALLPLAFAAMVWPARRVWALRSVELLVALILSKLAVVAVLTLGGAALEQSPGASWLTGLVLLVLGLFAPWAMLRLVPFAELAAGAAGHLRAQAGGVLSAGALAVGAAEAGHDWVSATTAQMRREAGQEPGATRWAQLPGGAEPEPGDANPLAGPAGEGGSPGGAGAVGGGGGTMATAPAAAGAGAEGVEVAAGTRTAVATGGGRGERLPGLGPMWQAGNYEWPEMQLDGTADWWAEAFPAGAEPGGGPGGAEPGGGPHVAPPQRPHEEAPE